MTRYVRLDSNNNMVEVLTALPASYKNISNFPNYPHISEYGFYVLIDIKPVYDPVYQRLAPPNRVVDDQQNEVRMVYPVVDNKPEAVKDRLLKTLEALLFQKKQSFEVNGLTMLSDHLMADLSALCSAFHYGYVRNDDQYLLTDGKNTAWLNSRKVIDLLKETHRVKNILNSNYRVLLEGLNQCQSLDDYKNWNAGVECRLMEGV